MYRTRIEVETTGRGLHSITTRLASCAAESHVREGLMHVFIQHTSASLTIQENADPRVLEDLDGWFTRHVQDGDPHFAHVEEGDDDMSAHVRSALTDVSLTIPVVAGRLALGTWQGVFVFEHRWRPHIRRLVITVWD